MLCVVDGTACGWSWKTGAEKGVQLGGGAKRQACERAYNCNFATL